ncbi:hypothetical protein J6590_033856 [Homalodisca vitripennis]|nr:hypothetical protein J6590_033856 [Homalodisca vitripennis]
MKDSSYESFFTKGLHRPPTENKESSYRYQIAGGGWNKISGEGVPFVTTECKMRAISVYWTNSGIWWCLRVCVTPGGTTVIDTSVSNILVLGSISDFWSEFQFGEFFIEGESDPLLTLILSVLMGHWPVRGQGGESIQYKFNVLDRSAISIPRNYVILENVHGRNQILKGKPDHSQQMRQLTANSVNFDIIHQRAVLVQIVYLVTARWC